MGKILNPVTLDITSHGENWFQFQLHGIEYTAYRIHKKVTDSSHKVMTFSDFKAKHGIELADYFPQGS